MTDAVPIPPDSTLDELETAPSEELQVLAEAAASVVPRIRAHRPHRDWTWIVALAIAMTVHGMVLGAAWWNFAAFHPPEFSVQGGTGSGQADSEFAGNAGGVSTSEFSAPAVAPVAGAEPVPTAPALDALDDVAPPSALAEPWAVSAPSNSTVLDVTGDSDLSAGSDTLIGLPSHQGRAPGGNARRPAFAFNGDPSDAAAHPGQAAQSAGADDTPGDGGRGGGAPSACSGNQPPRYPAAALRQRIEGTVVLKVQILTDGSVGNLSVARSSGHQMLDDAAVEAVRLWRFKPATAAGVARACAVDLPVCFVLKA